MGDGVREELVLERVVGGRGGDEEFRGGRRGGRDVEGGGRKEGGGGECQASFEDRRKGSGG